jgi:hypothetical protein
VEGLNILNSILGNPSIDKIEVKNIDVDLSHPVTVTGTTSASNEKVSQLPQFYIGPYSITGRVKLAEDYLSTIQFTRRLVRLLGTY